MPTIDDFQKARMRELGESQKVTPRQISARLGIPVDTVRRYLKRWGIPTVKPGFHYTLKRDRVRDAERRAERRRFPNT